MKKGARVLRCTRVDSSSRTERVQCVAVEPGQHFGKARTCLARARIELMHDPRNVRSSMVPFDQGVTGEDLLEPAWSAREADDESGPERGQPQPARAAKKSAVNSFLQAADEIRIIVGHCTGAPCNAMHSRA